MVLNLADLRKDRTKYDSGRKRHGSSGKSGRNTSNLLYAPIVAIDGEGVTDLDGNHRYIMLADSTGRVVTSHSLSTKSCFEFLLGLPTRTLKVGFSISYDVCKWLVSLSRDKLATLWKNGRVEWGEYKIRWAPGKYITIAHPSTKRSAHIYDVFGFYQHSFVASLEEWNVGTSGQLERIRSMKASRSTFSEETVEQIQAYCIEECELLVQLVQKLRDSMIEGGIPINQWYGAGAIAAAIMKKEGVKKYLERRPPESWSIPVMGAYFGGRFELYKAGRHENVYTYDIRSAYPYIATSLPCQSHMVFTRVSGLAPVDWGICRVSWSVPISSQWPPFPFRIAKTRQIVYPTTGSGYYHLSEVRAAIRMYGDAITVHETYQCETHCEKVGCDGKPFGFIPEYFAFRKELKRRGSQAQLTVKLGLNSLYGKTAQGVGWGDKKPPYQSYLWAGMITAGTRAMLLDAIAQNPEAVLWTATDGIVSTVPLDLPCGSELGEWEDDTALHVFSVQSGVYQVLRGIPFLPEQRSRGFGKQETSFAEIEAAFNSDPIGGTFSYDCTRFVGLGGALSRKEFWQWFGRWVPMTRSINFHQSKRFAESEIDPFASDSPPIRYFPMTGVVGQDVSAEFTPKSSWVDMWERENDEQTLATLIDIEQP